LSPNNFVAGGVEKSLPVIFSIEGCVLSEQERGFFREANPLGFILFNKPGARNIESPAQLRKLTDSLKEVVGRNCPILIDQEGGRVQRLRPPNWRAYPPMRHFGELAETNMDQALEELRFVILQLAEELLGVGVNVDCAPVLDVLSEVTHDVIGDRAFSRTARYCRAIGCLGLPESLGCGRNACYQTFARSRARRGGLP
jgi:beta-N-acetylhexosaminidase